ncbi:lysophospholipase [Deinococcus cavernae]|uniref:Lysophospholipase n=1 Tax=Deinococcus cavernae TaxID=2320857 RepID=A0A418VAB4_9DEIO|nr:alpha/beta hydrolase [Deinococcus cavernae]RJF73030.1 lysophospholipase [Deinococcus cavernae]
MLQLEWTVPDAPVKGYVWQALEPRGIVLLSHGFGEYAGRYVEKYHGLIPALVGAGFTVYSYDQRGHGASEGRRAVVDMHVLVGDHLKAREALRHQPLPVFLLGHSMGGLIAAASAVRDPRGLRGVILSSPALLVGEDESPLKKRLAPLLGRLFPAAPVKQLSTASLSRRQDEVAAYESDRQVYHGKVPALCAASMLNLSEGLWRRYAQWHLPTLVFHGSADTVTDPRGSRQFHEAIAAQDKTFVEFEGGYHELLNDECRAEVRELILRWLGERTP